MSNGTPDTFSSNEFCKLVLEDPSLCWRSRSVRALIVPSLCAPMILGLPFLSFNHLIVNYASRSVIDSSCGFDLLNPVVPCPMPTLRPPKNRRRALFLDQQCLLDLKKDIFEEAAQVARCSDKFARFSASEPVRPFDVVAAVRARIEELGKIERLQKLSDAYKLEFADVFTPIAHTDHLPSDVTCKI
ncbi:hypothetical protein F5050DRAFT_1582242, partial [Lentinula boryana]